MTQQCGAPVTCRNVLSKLIYQSVLNDQLIRCVHGASVLAFNMLCFETILSFFSILRWWYTVRVCVCLSAFLSHPSHHRTIQSRTEGGGNVDFSGVGIGSEQRASENYEAELTQRCWH